MILRYSDSKFFILLIKPSIKFGLSGTVLPNNNNYEIESCENNHDPELPHILDVVNHVDSVLRRYFRSAATP